MKKPPNISEVLRGVPTESYGENHSDHILEMWKTYLGMADRISDRRERANAFFAAIHTGAFASIGFFIENQMYPWIMILSVFVGLPFAYIWYRLVRSYRDLNSAKFKVVHEVETMLPLKLFDAEWEAVGRGNDPNLYLPFTQIEVKAPIILYFAYVFLALLALYLSCR